MNILSRVLLVVSAVAVFGCVTPASYTTASAIGKGNLQVALEPAAVGAASGSGFAFVPMGNLSVRYGLSDRFELGGRIGGTAIELLGKFQFTDPDNERLAISIAPSAGGLAISSGASGGGTSGSASVGMFGFQLPVLIGLKTGGGSEFFVGPRILDWLIFAGSSAGGSSANATVNILNVGTSVGYYARLGESFALVPELNVLYPLYSTAGASTGGSSASAGGFGQGVLLQFGLGIVFGKGYVSQADAGPPPTPPPAG